MKGSSCCPAALLPCLQPGSPGLGPSRDLPPRRRPGPGTASPAGTWLAPNKTQQGTRSSPHTFHPLLSPPQPTELKAVSTLAVQMWVSEFQSSVTWLMPLTPKLRRWVLNPFYTCTASSSLTSDSLSLHSEDLLPVPSAQGVQTGISVASGFPFRDGHLTWFSHPGACECVRFVQHLSGVSFWKESLVLKPPLLAFLPPQPSAGIRSHLQVTWGQARKAHLVSGEAAWWDDGSLGPYFVLLLTSRFHRVLTQGPRFWRKTNVTACGQETTGRPPASSVPITRGSPVC